MRTEAALLDWYLAMGVDEAMEETPQNRMVSAVPAALSQSPDSPHAAPTAGVIANGNNAPPPSPPAPSIRSAATQNSVSELMEETKKLAAGAKSLSALEEAVRKFKGLNICKTATSVVFADGHAESDLMIIGEAPGAEEDRQGIPFCGPSGQLLDKMLSSIGYSRERNCYITNVIFWRPPGNRNPTEEERAVCLPFVQKHIALIKPKLILLAGSVAVNTILQESRSISKLRKDIHIYKNPVDESETPAIASYHPSYLLRQPLQKKLAWQDMIAVEAHLKKE